MSFAAWAAQTTAQDKRNNSGSRTSVMAATAASDPLAGYPPDVEVLGRSTWTLLHSIAATYPVNPSSTERSDLLTFIGLLAKLYPCRPCAEDFQKYISLELPLVGSHDEFGTWLCGAHNEVNRRLGKPEFDCFKWEERWSLSGQGTHSD